MPPKTEEPAKLFRFTVRLEQQIEKGVERTAQKYPGGASFVSSPFHRRDGQTEACAVHLPLQGLCRHHQLNTHSPEPERGLEILLGSALQTATCHH